MHTGKTYETRDAIIAVMLAQANGQDFDLKAKLREHTFIPPERIAFAASEIGQTLFGLKQVAKFLRVMADDDDQLLELIEGSLASAPWTDDDKRDLTVRAYAEKEEGEPLFTVATKLKGDGE